MQIIDTLVNHLQSLPGLGPRSARRIALHLLTRTPETLRTLAEGFQTAYETITICETCGNIDSETLCQICRDSERNPAVIAIVESISDLWAMERSRVFRGRYHVLGGVLSAVTGVGPEQLRLDVLHRRIRTLIDSRTPELPVELILATNLTVEGQTTTHYITQNLSENFGEDEVKITRLAHGLPAGAELDYMDDSTIVTALKARS